MSDTQNKKQQVEHNEMERDAVLDQDANVARGGLGDQPDRDIRSTGIQGKMGSRSDSMRKTTGGDQDATQDRGDVQITDPMSSRDPSINPDLKAQQRDH